MSYASYSLDARNSLIKILFIGSTLSMVGSIESKTIRFDLIKRLLVLTIDNKSINFLINGVLDDIKNILSSSLKPNDSVCWKYSMVQRILQYDVQIEYIFILNSRNQSQSYLDLSQNLIQIANIQLGVVILRNLLEHVVVDIINAKNQNSIEELIIQPDNQNRWFMEILLDIKIQSGKIIQIKVQLFVALIYSDYINFIYLVQIRNKKEINLNDIIQQELFKNKIINLVYIRESNVKRSQSKVSFQYLFKVLNTSITNHFFKSTLFVNLKEDFKSKTLINIENYLFYKTKKDKLKWIDIRMQLQNNFIIKNMVMSYDWPNVLIQLKYFVMPNMVQIFKMVYYSIRFNSNYILSKRIGKGQFYEAKNKTDVNEYAIKIYQKSNFFAEVDRAAIQKQISVLRRLQSDFTIQFYEVFENTDQIFVVQELFMGGNLMDYIIREDFFSENQATRLIFLLVKAVNYIHLKYIIHHDIKPQNLVLDFKIMLKLFVLKSSNYLISSILMLIIILYVVVHQVLLHLKCYQIKIMIKS